jgi:hypothetical protein
VFSNNLEDSYDSSSDNEDDVSCLHDSMRTGSFPDSFLDVLKKGNGNLIESNEITKNFMALKDKEKGGIKGIKLVTKQALKDKQNATCFMVKSHQCGDLDRVFSGQFKLR